MGEPMCQYQDYGPAARIPTFQCEGDPRVLREFTKEERDLIEMAGWFGVSYGPILLNLRRVDGKWGARLEIPSSVTYVHGTHTATKDHLWRVPCEYETWEDARAYILRFARTNIEGYMAKGTTGVDCGPDVSPTDKKGGE